MKLDQSSPIRVMRIIARMNVGGPAIHVSLLTARLRDPEYHSTLVTGILGEGEADMTYLAHEMGVEPIVIPSMQREIKLIDDAKTLLDLIRLMRRQRPHIVHTHTAKAGLVGRAAAKLVGVPVIVHTFHGHTFHGYFGKLKTRVFIWLERLMAAFSDATLTISETLRDDLIRERITRSEQIHVLPLGLDLDKFAAADRLRGGFRKDSHFSTDTPLIGIIGRLVPIKNHKLFLQAASEVHAAIPQSQFVIVGGGECQSELEALTAQLRLTDVVHFIGWRQDLPAIYTDLNLVVISSDNEGTPVSLIEAMAAGVPVVSTAVGGVPDLLCHGEMGALVPAGDAHALANAMITTLRAPPDTAKAQNYVLQQYGIDRLVSDIRQLYVDLLSRKRR